MRASRCTLVVLMVALAGLAIPPSEASRPEARFGIIAADLARNDLLSNVRFDPLSVDDITPGQLRQYDGLVLNAEALERAWSDPGKRAALQSLVNSHRILALEGSADVLARFDLPGLATGGDVPADANGPLPVAAGIRLVYRTAGGAWAAGAFEYGERGLFESLAAADVAAWTNALPDFEPRAGGAFGAEAADNGNWIFRTSNSYAYTWNPYGRIGYGADFHYAFNDGTSNYKWFNVGMDQETTPGIALYGGTNTWRTHMAWLTSDVRYYVSTNGLVDWFPYADVDSTYGVLTVNGEMGMQSGYEQAPLTSKQSQSTTLDHMYLVQASTAGSDQVYARHDFEYGTGPTAGVWTNAPAFTVRVEESLCFKIPWQNKVQWRQYTPTGYDNYYTTWINSWRELC